MYDVSFHCDGALVATGGFDAVGRIWDLRSGKVVWNMRGHARQVQPNEQTLVMLMLSHSSSYYFPIHLLGPTSHLIRFWLWIGTLMGTMWPLAVMTEL